jgi:hypothetical protein
MANGGGTRRMIGLGRRPYRTSSPKCEGRQVTRFMKRNVEKLSAEDMRFFTRELYIDFNSADPIVADAADELWEQAIKAYQRHMRLLRPKLSDGAKRLAKISFHDARLMNSEHPVLLGLPGVGLIALAQHIAPDNWETYLIWYVLCGEIQSLPSPMAEWPFSNGNTEGLYDEFDLNPQDEDLFVHRILLSDGRVIVVPFANAGVQKLAKDAASVTKQVMQLT